MVIKEIQSNVLQNYSVDCANEFLAKALNYDKKQKQIIKKLYDDRDIVVANFSTELVLRALLTPSFLDCIEGRKLAAYFLLDNLESNEFLNFIKVQVKSNDPKKTLCERWGEIIIYAWKVAPDDNNKGQKDEITKEKLEKEIIQDLFYYSIIYPKKYNQKFAMIVDGFLSDCVKKKFSAMFFRCLLPILWRNLESVNEDVRLAASRLLLKFYPLQASDNALNFEYLQKQNVAMQNMLNDECVLIRTEAIKKIFLHLGLHWTAFPRYIIKIYLEKIIDELSLDSIDDVRAAVYEGMVHLLFCSQAYTAVKHALEILGKRGINDKAEKVRIAAFKLLNHLLDHRELNCFEFVNMENVLMRLDFEHSNHVQVLIVKLILKSFCPKAIEGLDYKERFQRIRYMCKISRNASLNFHCHIYSLQLISIDTAVRHITNLIIAVNAYIKKTFPNNYTKTGLDVSELSIANTTISEKKIDNENHLKSMKDVLDSIIVLWVSMRNDLYSKYANENSKILKIMSNLLQNLNSFWDTSLVDTALTIASYLPENLVGSVIEKVNTIIMNGNSKEIFFSHYVEAFSFWQMDKLTEIVQQQLERLCKIALCDIEKNNIDCIKVVDKLENQLNFSGNSVQNSPLKKRRKVHKEQNIVNSSQARLEQSLELLQIMLSSRTICAKLTQKYSDQITTFCKILLKIRKAFGVRLKINNFNNIDMQILINAYRTLTLLSLINKDINSNSDDFWLEDKECETWILDDDSINANDTLSNFAYTKTYSVQDRLFLAELNWFKLLQKNISVPYPIIKMFLQCTILHLDCSCLSAKALYFFTKIICEIYEITDKEIMDDNVKQCVKHLVNALEYCDDQLLAQGLVNNLKPLINKNLNYMYN